MSPPLLLPPEGGQETEAIPPRAATSSGTDSEVDGGSMEPDLVNQPASQRRSTASSGGYNHPGPIQADHTDPESRAEATATGPFGTDEAEGATLGGETHRTSDSLPTRLEQQPSQKTVTSAEMFAALVEAMAESPNVGQVEAWRTTIRHLFAEVYKTVPIQTEALPAARKRFPAIHAAEAASLLGLFEQVFVRSKGTFSDWQKLATAIAHELLNTKWAFKEIIRRLASQHKWTQAPVLNQWAQVVRQGAPAPRTDHPQVSNLSPGYDDFMFDPSAFSRETITRLTSLCAAPAARAGQHQVRAGTDDEWAIITGLVEGTVACRRMPDFIQQVLKSEERLRLYSTIQAQVEGELTFQLDRARVVPLSRRTTKAITEAILESAELARINLQDLHLMLSQTKTIGYDHVTKTIHFYFFTRTTAERHKDVRVPFRGAVYRLQNAHRPEHGSIWRRQQGLNGKQQGRRVEYTVHLHNLTRFSDVGRIAAYFKANIPTEFEMEDLDTHTPNSRTSTIWRVTFKLAGCPTFLDGIVRLLWFGTTIIVKHPNVGHRLQCLQCGNLGHTIARCGFTDALLRGPGGLVVKEADVRELEDLAKPFSSLDEIRAMAARRLTLQEAAEKAAQAAVTPPCPRGAGTSPGTVPVPPPAASTVSSAPHVEQGKKFEHVQPQPKPVEQHPWLTSLSKKGRAKKLNPRVFAVIPTDRENRAHNNVEETQHADRATATKRKDTSTVPLSSSESTAEIHEQAPSRTVSPHTPNTSDRSHRKKAGRERGPAPTSPIPVLLTRQRTERNSFSRLVQSLTKQRTEALPIGARSVNAPASLEELEQQLGLRSAVTPATGNCLAMAISQAAVDVNLDDPGRTLECLTACLKRGIKYSGLIDLEGQLAHDHRVNLLTNVGRGWPGMTRAESASQVRWYLDDYAMSTSIRTESVPEDAWGGSDTVGMASNFLKRTIYVVQRTDGESQEWRCVKYVPTTVSRHHSVVETWAEYSLSVEVFMDEVVAGKIDSPSSPPLVLQYQPRHYSAFLHSGYTSRLPDFEMEVILQSSSASKRIGNESIHIADLATSGDADLPTLEQTLDAASPLHGNSTIPPLVAVSSRSEQSGALVTVERQLVPVGQPTKPTRGLRRAPLQDRKRAHTSSPEQTEPQTSKEADQCNTTLFKRGRGDQMPPLMLTQGEDYDRIDRDDWAAAWDLMEPAWPNPQTLPFPNANSSTLEWERVARLAPDHLLWLVKRFVFPGELLQILDTSVFVQWMTESRRDCVVDALQRYSETPMDEQSKSWVLRWLDNARRRPDDTMLAPLIDNMDDWTKLEARSYAGDDLLKLCDPRRRSRLSHHLLCALLYDKEIAALVEGFSSVTRVAGKIRSHFKLIATNAKYKEAYYSSTNLADWAAIESFFYAGLARLEEKPLHQY